MKLELTHDMLAREVFQQATPELKQRREVTDFLRDRFALYEKRGKLLDREDLEYFLANQRFIDMQSREGKFLQESHRALQRARRRRRRTILGVIFSLAALTVIAIWFAFKAEANLRESIANLANAMIQEQRALDNAQLAEQERKKSSESADQAMKARDVADRARIEAETLRDLANRERDHARQEAALAESRRLAAQAFQWLPANPTFSMSNAEKALAIRRTDYSASAYWKARYRDVYDYYGGTYSTPFYQEYLGHRSIVFCLAFTPDGRYLVSSSQDSTIRIWATDRRELVYTITLDDIAQNFSLSSDGKVLAAGIDSDIAIWSFEKGYSSPVRKSNLATQKREIMGVEFSPDNRYLLSFATDSTVRVWSVEEPQLHSVVLPFPAKINQARFINSGKEILIGLEDSTVYCWLRNGMLKWGPHSFPAVVRSVAASENGTYYFIGLANGQLIILDPSGHNVFNEKIHDKSIFSLNFSNDFRYLVVSSGDESASVWEWLQKGPQLLKRVLPLNGHNQAVTQAAFSPDHRIVVTASFDRTIKWWDLCRYPIPTYRFNDRVDDVAGFMRNGREYLLVASDNNAYVIDPGGKQRQALSGHTSPIVTVAVSAQGDFLTGDLAGRMILWNAQGLKLREVAHSSSIFDVAFSPDGQYLLAASADSLAYLYTKEGRLIRTFAHNERVYAACFSPDGSRILTASWDKLVRIWEPTGKVERKFQDHFKGLYDACFSPDGALIASAGRDLTAKIWQKNGSLLQTLTTPGEGHGEGEGIRSLQFSPDGNYLVTSGFDNAIRIWNLAGEELLILAGHTEPVLRVIFSSDGHYLISGSWDMTVKKWDIRLPLSKD